MKRGALVKWKVLHKVWLKSIKKIEAVRLCGDIQGRKSTKTTVIKAIKSKDPIIITTWNFKDSRWYVQKTEIHWTKLDELKINKEKLTWSQIDDYDYVFFKISNYRFLWLFLDIYRFEWRDGVTKEFLIEISEYFYKFFGGQCFLSLRKKDLRFFSRLITYYRRSGKKKKRNVIFDLTCEVLFVDLDFNRKADIIPTCEHFIFRI